MSSKYFEYYNANPFGVKTGDCAIRAVSKALNMSYRDVCKKLGVKFKKGKGMVSDNGIDLLRLQEVFDTYFDKVENFDSESYEKPDEFKDENDPFLEPGEFDQDISKNDSVDEFIKYNKGKYLVGCADKNGVTGGHIVYVDADTDDDDKKKFYDTWDCGKKKVDSFMMIKDPSEWGKKSRSDSEIRSSTKKMSGDDMLKLLQKFTLESIK